MSFQIGNLDIGVAFAGDVSNLQQATGAAGAAIDGFGTKATKSLKDVSAEAKAADDSMARLANGIKGAFVGGSIAVGLIKLKNTIIETSDALIQAQVQLDKWNNGFKFGAGSASGGARELAFVREEANRLGLELSGAATQYMKMVAAARGSNMEGEKTRVLFTSIAEAATVMGMSGEQSERAMMAVVQMMSKGKVQAEELRGQLGEHLPGAFAIAARAMGVTEVELNKLMETGQVMSADFLPKFAAQLRNELGGSVEDATKSMQASLNRFETAWLSFKQNVSESGVSDAIGGQINILSDAFNGISERMEAARKAGGGFWSQTAAGAGGVAQFLNPINALSYSAISLQGQLEQAKTKLNELEKERPYSGNIFLGPAIEETKQLIAELERAKSARDQLARQPGTGLSESRYSAMVDDAALASQREKAKAYAEFWEKNAGPQAQFAAAVIAAKKAMGEFFTPETEANIRERLIKPTHQAKEKIDEFTKSAMRGLELYSDLNATEGGLSKDFAEKWVQLNDAYTAAYISIDHLIAAQAELLKQQPFYKKGLDDEKEALKEQAKATAEATKAYDTYFDAVQKNTATLLDNIQSESQSATAIGLTKIAVSELEAAKLQDMAASKERAALTWESIDLSGQMSENLRAEAKALRDLGAVKINRAVIETIHDDAKQAADAWKKASEDIEKSLTDALMRGFESGKGFAEVLRDTVVNMFKTLVLRPVVSAIVSPIATAATGAVSSAAGGFASSAVGSAVGGSVLGGATIGSVGQYAATGFMNTVAGTGTATGMSAGAAVGGANGAAMTAGAIAPWVLGALAIGSLIESLDDSGTYHSGGLGSFSAAGGAATGNAVKGQGLGFDLASKDYTASGEQAAAQIAQAVVGLLDSTATTFGSKAGAYAATAFADDTSKDGAWGALMVRIGDQTVIDWKNGTDKWPGREFSNGEAGAREYAAAVAKDVRDYLITQTPDWADTMLNALGDAPSLEALGQVVAQINAAATAIETMGMASQAFAGLSEAATSALITAMGGAEAAVANLSGYYTNFYSESERASIATQQLTEQFAALGVALPASRDAFRELVDTAVAAGDTTLSAGLLKLQGGFSALVPAAADAAAAVSSAVSSMQAESKRLQRELLALQGGDLRAFDTNGMSAAEVAIYDYNQSLRDQISAAKEAAEAAATAAQRAAEEAQRAADTYANALRDAQDYIAGVAKTVGEWVDAQNANTANPTNNLASARAAFAAQMAFARGGDRDAINGITGYADRLLQAGSERLGYIQQQQLLAQTKAQLIDLPKQLSPEQFIVEQLTPIISAVPLPVVSAIGTASDSQVQAINALAANYAAALQPVISALGTGFATLDTNLSNDLTLAELTTALQGKATDAAINALFGLIDTDNDAIIGKLEASVAASLTFGQQVKLGLASEFTKLDTSVNGLLDATEFTAAFAGLATDATLQAVFNEIDTNGDGIITAVEAQTAANNTLFAALGAALNAGFATLDTNLSGGLTQPELAAVMQGKATDAAINALFGLIDTDNDAIIGKLEASVAASLTFGQQVKLGLASEFTKLDTSVNGLLDATEFTAAFAGLATDATLQAVFNEIDTNGDGIITAVEAQTAANNTLFAALGAALNAGFATLDTNLSGGITQPELAAVMQGKASDAAINALFDLIDVDNDSIISKLEATTAAALTFGQQVASGLSADFTKLDTSVNGLLDFTEFSTAFAGLATNATLQAVFDEIDANGNGQITALEAIAANTVAMSAGVTFSATDPIHSVFDAIKESTGSSAYYLGTITALIHQVEMQLARTHNLLGSIGYFINSAYSGTGSFQIRGATSYFAKGGVFSNQVVSSPTLFNMAMMGEAGDEAIMPLSRGADGRLGVTAQVHMPDWSQYGRNDNAALVAEIKRLNDRLARIEAATTAAAVHSADSADSLRNIKNNGLEVFNDPATPLVTEAAP